MTTRRSTIQLERYEERYRELARRLASIGYIVQGSLAPRFTRCGRATCVCSAEPPKLHGPYWHWSTKVNGKTVNRRLSEQQATLYNEWIDNDRRAKALLAQMRELAAKTTELILEEEPG
ncbi:MAG: DUF6788 family protein [Acidimicrobiales bacterium]